MNVKIRIRSSKVEINGFSPLTGIFFEGQEKAPLGLKPNGEIKHRMKLGTRARLLLLAARHPLLAVEGHVAVPRQQVRHLF